MLKKILPLLLMALSLVFGQTTAALGDMNLIEVTVEGLGSTQQGALDQAKREAISTAIGTFITSETEVQNYMTVKDKVLAKSEGFVKSYEMLNKNKSADGMWTVKIKAVVSKEMLLTDLEALGVLMSQLDNPKIVVFYAPKGVAYDERYTEQGINGINKYLTTNRYDVYDLDQLNAMIEDDISMKQVALGEEVDMAEMLAKKLKADLYITVALLLEDVGNGKKKAKATAKIFNASTAKLLGTENGYSDEIFGNNTAFDANIDQATKKLMPLMMNQVKNFWKLQIDKGRQFELLFSGLPKGMPAKMALAKTLKSVCKEVKKVSDTQYTVWYQGSLDELQEAIYEPIQEVYKKEIDMKNRGDRLDIFPAK